jgi:hypothetical protein
MSNFQLAVAFCSEDEQPTISYTQLNNLLSMIKQTLNQAHITLHIDISLP